MSAYSILIPINKGEFFISYELIGVNIIENECSIIDEIYQSDISNCKCVDEIEFTEHKKENSIVFEVYYKLSVDHATYNRNLCKVSCKVSWDISTRNMKALYVPLHMEVLEFYAMLINSGFDHAIGVYELYTNNSLLKDKLYRKTKNINILEKVNVFFNHDPLLG